MIERPRTLEELDAIEAMRKDAGARLDPETAEACLIYANVVDPYGEFELRIRLTLESVAARLLRLHLELNNSNLADAARDLRHIADLFDFRDCVGKERFYRSGEMKFWVAASDVPIELRRQADEAITSKRSTDDPTFDEDLPF